MPVRLDTRAKTTRQVAVAALERDRRTLRGSADLVFGVKI